MKIYLASSWRNEAQPEILSLLTRAGHDVYDFRNPASMNTGFSWREVHPEWKVWNAQQFRDGLAHPVAQAGFRLDRAALDWAEAGVLLLPCGKSAHLEAGYLAGQGKPVIVLLTEAIVEAELMYLLCHSIATNRPELLQILRHLEEEKRFG